MAAAGRRPVLRLRNVHPGEVLLEEYMKPFGMGIVELARAMGVAPARLRGVVRGTRSVSPETALALEAVLGTEARFWLGLQCDYDLERARQGRIDLGHDVAGRLVAPCAHPKPGAPP